MDKLFTILWLVPGYLFLYFWRLIVPYKKGNDWNYLIPIGICSAIFFFCATLLGFIIDLERLKIRWISLFQKEDLFELLIASVLSIICGILLIMIPYKFIIKNESFPSARNFFINVFKFFGYLQFSDSMSEYLYDLLNQQIIISLNSGKFYIGTLISASEKEGDKDKAIKISPIWSGYRDTISHKVVFDTQYGDTKREDLELIFPLTSINSIGKFDIELHKFFLETGKTLIKKKKRKNITSLENNK